MGAHCLQTFERLSELFIARYIQPLWAANVGFENDQWLSLRLFLQMYAFERQGRSPDYSFAAVDAIDDNRSVPLDRRSARKVWESFAARLRDLNLNHANNPLCPKGTKYPRNYRTGERDTEVKKSSALQVAAELGKPLVAWARECLENNNARDTHARLRQINGIGNKIASFFLRDVATAYRVAPTKNRHLLQPVDVWIRFVVQKLSCDDQLNDTQCARWIVRKSAKPECMNQGIWYFSANIAHSSQYVVARALKEPKLFDELISKHLDDVQRAAKSAKAYANQH